MPLKKIIISVWLAAAWLSNPAVLTCQQGIDAEAEYKKIRELAINGDKAVAEISARALLDSFPGYGDARILLGRIMAWQMKYKEALEEIDLLLASEPGNSDALDARADIIRWMNPVSEAPEEITPETSVRAGYSADYFNEPYLRLWKVYSAGLSHKFKWGKALAGINAGSAELGNDPVHYGADLQFEAEAWPVLSKKNYARIAYAFSKGTYFPSHRASGEIWQIFQKGWAFSAGLDWYYFDTNIFIAGLSAEKYLGRFWFSGKGYIYFKEEGPTSSLYLNSRYYFNPDDYLQLTVGTGTAPDEPFDIQSDIMRLSATGIKLIYRRKLNSLVHLQLHAGYSSEEYAEEQRRNRFEGGAGLVFPLNVK
jgi:YaiO family outer membrane protein